MLTTLLEHTFQNEGKAKKQQNVYIAAILSLARFTEPLPDNNIVSIDDISDQQHKYSK